MIDPKDMAHCEEAIRHGSLSFHAASRALPKSVREPALALYAFCRLADDEVDLKADKAPAVLALQERMEAAFAGEPMDTPMDRAFAAMVRQHDMPKELPQALLEGLAWDAQERRYETLSDVRSYSARVASAVGAMMCVLMGVRDRNALARACDLGVAMQLTNISRDVGEDALEGRLYLPMEWLSQAGIDVEQFLATQNQPRPFGKWCAVWLWKARGFICAPRLGSHACLCPVARVFLQHAISMPGLARSFEIRVTKPSQSVHGPQNHAKSGLWVSLFCALPPVWSCRNRRSFMQNLWRRLNF